MVQRVKEITLKGFKSFNSKTVIKFPEKLCCIVGANGSGKSNILDAMCFVLGKMSKKDMRAEKLDHLIYNGGKTGKAANYAEVILTLENKDKVFPVEEHELVITRTIYPQGGSEFRINNKKTTRSQIIDVLAYAHIDPDGYNIILQDEIKRFVEMSSIERRQVVEDLSGIAVYEEKKQKAIFHLDEVDRKIRETMLVLNEREKNLKELEKQKKQAELYLDLQKDKKFKEACFYWKKIEIGKDKVNSIKENIESLSDKIKEIDTKIGEKNNEIEENKKMILKIRVIEKTKPEMKLMEEVDSLRERRIGVKNSIENHINELKKLAKRRVEVSKNLDSLQKELDEKLEEKNKMEEKLNNLREELKDKETTLESATLGTSILYNVEADLLRYQEFEKKSDKRDELKKEYSNLAVDLERKEKEYKKIIKEISESNDSLMKVKRDIRELNESKMQKREELAKLRSSHEASFESFGGGVKEIIKKGFGGVFDTVGAIGSVKKEFSLPLRIAAGARIDNIIVEDEDVAKRCIEHLRKERKGVATFLPLTKIKPHEEDDTSDKLKMEGVRGLALSFINYPKKFDKIYKYVFGSTLIVNSIDVAKKIGINTVRMVTMDGDLVEKSGAISGGFRVRTTGSFRVEEIEQRIADYEKEITECEEELNASSSTSEELNDSVMSLSLAKNTFETEIKFIEQRVKEITDNLDELKDVPEKSEISSKLKELEKKKNRISVESKNVDESQVKNIRSEVANLKEKDSELSKRFNELSIKIGITQKDIEQSKGNVLSSIKKDISSFKDGLKSLKEEYLSIKKELAEKDKTTKSLVKERDSLLEQKDKLEEKNELIDEEMKKIEEKKHKFELEAQKHEVEIANHKANLDTLKEEFSKNYRGIDIGEVTHKPETLKSEIEELEKKIKELGAVNMLALEEYKKIEEQYTIVDKQVKVLDLERNDVVTMINDIESRKKKTFLDSFQQVATSFEQLFAELSPDGWGKLTIENNEDPFAGGIEIEAKPRGKKVMTLSQLSGGEKTITAIAFIFSIQEAKNSPFYVMDEIDAALDKENSKRLSLLVNKYSKGSQFIIISHNDAVICAADRLVGVAMDSKSGESKVVGIKMP